MPWPVHPTGFFGARGDSDTYQIERSLRFNSADSAYLNRTNVASPTSANKWTWSGWVRRGTLGVAQTLIGQCNSGSDDSYIYFLANNTLALGSYSGVGADYGIITSAVFRDPSSWYHIVAVLDTPNATAADRAILYVNGVRQVVSNAVNGMWTQNATNNKINAASQPVNIGRRPNFNDVFFDGYLTEINFIDGQALTPSSFGQTDPITGRWAAKEYNGTYGTNGFYLKFADNSGTTSTTLGKDSSGNGNNWTPNNFSVTAGAGNDSLVDSPTNYGSDSGVGGQVRGNYSTLNVTDINSSIALVGNGNLEFTQNSNGTIGIRRSTIAITSGKWYFEAVPANVTAFSTQHTIGIVGTDHSLSNYVGSGANGYAYRPDGNKLNNGTATAYGTTTTANTDVIMVAFDADNWRIWFGKNGTWFASGDPVAGTNAAFSSIVGGTYLFAVGSQHTGFGAATWITNFGQRPFAYTAPSGFKALCTQNLPQPTIQKPGKYMDALAYTGTGASNAISSLGFSPDLVWIKNRGTTTDHALYDIVRGAQAQLSSNTTGSEVTSSSGLTAFDSAGFTIGTSSLVNTSGTQYVAWSWDAGSTNSTNIAGSTTSIVRANPQAGFSVVSYTGNGSAATIGHGLGATPKMIIAKTRSTTGDWVVGHASLDSSSPWGYYIFLSSTAARNSAGAINSWGNNTVVVPPTSTVFSVGNGANLNSNGITYIAYCFAEIEGYSKFGSYTGNGSSDGPFVWCGFRPRLFLWKRYDTTGAWNILDTARDTFNLSGKALFPHLSNAEFSGSVMDINSNGVKLRDSSADNNASGGTYIFAAFAESPFKYARAR